MDISECILLNTYPIHIHGPLLHLITASKTGKWRLPLEVLKRWENFTEALKKIWIGIVWWKVFQGVQEKVWSAFPMNIGMQCMLQVNQLSLMFCVPRVTYTLQSGAEWWMVLEVIMVDSCDRYHYYYALSSNTGINVQNLKNWVLDLNWHTMV